MGRREPGATRETPNPSSAGIEIRSPAALSPAACFQHPSYKALLSVLLFPLTAYAHSFQSKTPGPPPLVLYIAFWLELLPPVKIYGR